jgi:hypothetical protein
MNKVKNIYVSETLKDILFQFKNKSVVASLLLEDTVFEDQLVNNHVNYLSTSNSDSSKISYLTKERISKIDESEIWSTSKRYHSKPGSIISKIYQNISPREVENFSNLFRAFADKKHFKFEVVKSEIVKYYHQDSYAEFSGSLGNSCMKYDRCSKFLELYIDNGVVTMLTMKNDSGALLGRALLWQFDGNKVMDRIYTINDEDYQFYFMNWAEEHGFIYKKRQNWSNTLQFVKDGKEIESKLSIQLSDWDYSYYPYLDTFKWFDKSSGMLFNYRPDYFTENIDDFCLLMSPEGSYLNVNSLEFDSISKDWHHQGNLIWLSYCGFYTQREHVVYSETLDKFILRKDAYYSEELRDNLFKDESLIDISKEIVDQIIEDRKQYIQKLLKQEEIQKLKITQRVKDLNIDGNLLNSFGIEQFILDQLRHDNDTELEYQTDNQNYYPN